MKTKTFYVGKIHANRYLSLCETYEEAEKEMHEEWGGKDETSFVDNFTFEIDEDGELLRVVSCDGDKDEELCSLYDKHFNTRAYLESDE